MDEVAKTDFRAIDLKLPGYCVDHSFYRKAHKGFADAAIGDHGAAVGHDRIAFIGNRAQAITVGDVAQHEQIVARGEIDAGAFVFNVAEFDRQHRSVGFNCRAHLHDAVRRMAQRQQVLAPVFDPFHRPARLARQQRCGDDKKRPHLIAERAAHRRHDHTDLARRDTESRGEHVQILSRLLGVSPDRVGLRHRFVLRHDAESFERRRTIAVNRHALIDDRIGFFKGAFHVAVGKRIVPENIRANLFEDQRRVGPERLLRVEHGRQGIVFYLDEIGRVFRGRPVHRGDADHRLADVTHLLIGQGVNFRRVGQRYPAALRPGELRDLLAGDHGVDAGMIEGAAHIDVANLGARMQATHVSRVGDTGQGQVVDEMIAFCYKPVVLGAFERLPNPFGFHITHSTRLTHHEEHSPAEPPPNRTVGKTPSYISPVAGERREGLASEICASRENFQRS